MDRDSSFSLKALIATIILATVAFVISASGDRDPGLYISEVCPHNDDIIYDKIGSYHDYLVITNGSDSPVSLSGYSVSDDKTDPAKYVFPDVTLTSGDSILVWADSRPVFEGGFTDENALYTGFGLRDHEYVFLAGPDGAVIDSVRLPAMKRNIALLRTHAGDRGQKGIPNEQENPSPVISEAMNPPVLSATSGYYESPFFLTADGDGNKVYYTVDGSSPYFTGVSYTEPIPIIDRTPFPNYFANLGPVSIVTDQFYPSEPISKGTVVRAISQGKDGSFSRETIAVFFVGEEVRKAGEGVYTLSIVSDTEGLFSSDKGIYVAGRVWEMNSEEAIEKGIDLHQAPANYNMRGRGWRRDARLTLFDPQGKCLYDEDDKISVRGGFARSFLQKNFTLMPAQNGKKVFDGLIENTGDSLVIRTGSFDDAFRTNFRDALNSRIAMNMKVGAQRSACCQVYLNGEYWGCYNLQERPDESFIEARYQVPAGNVIYIKNFIAESGLESDLALYRDLMEYIRVNDFSDDKVYADFCDMVDIDSLIDYYSAEIFYANEDAYVGNVALWRARKPGPGTYQDGKWRFILFDTDSSDAYYANVAGYDSFVEGNWDGISPMNEPIFSKLVDNPGFRKRFRERFTELLESDLSFERTGPLIDEMENTYKAPMVMSVRRYDDPQFTQDRYLGNVSVVRDFFRERCGYMYEYMMQHIGR